MTDETKPEAPAFVLFVDDDPTFLHTAESVFKPLGVNSITCSSAVEASRLVSSSPGDFQAVVCDVNFASEGEDAGIRLFESLKKDFGAAGPALFTLTDEALTAEGSRRLQRLGARVFDKGSLRFGRVVGLRVELVPSASASERVESALARAEIDAHGAEGARMHYCSCFISYADGDRAFAERLYHDLGEKGVRSWFAPKSMAIGSMLRPTIDRAISEHERFVLVLSAASIRSHWVRDEVEKAFERERRDGTTIVIPITLDDAVFNTDESWACALKNARHIGDFRHLADAAYQASLREVLRALQRPHGAASK